MNNIVTILLATYNGAEYLEDQLKSIVEQDYSGWKLIISDDGSSDNTKDLIERYISRNPHLDINLINGPQKGFSHNFLNMLQNVNTEYTCFCDQDDVWLPTKLSASINKIKSLEVPALFCARTTLINNNGETIGYSPLFKLMPSFCNALVQNIAGGNTMLFNLSARELLQSAYNPKLQLVSHDWWAYQILSGSSGVVYYDETPNVLYRQHKRNLIGSNRFFWNRIVRLRLLLSGEYKRWIKINLIALQSANWCLTPQNQKILSLFIKLRKANLIQRILLMRNLKLYRQTKIGNAALFVIILFNLL
tara:strand:+ start:3399 stop:4313 length:915 start_codon:yes stop_codon:yes gene_type:complete